MGARGKIKQARVMEINEKMNVGKLKVRFDCGGGGEVTIEKSLKLQLLLRSA